MTDIFTRKQRSKIMSSIRSKDSMMELRVRSALWSRGLRYRKHYGPYRVDIAFPPSKVAVFLDSCFWHGCHLHGSLPKTRMEFWAKKIMGNRIRDATVTRLLKKEGWVVVRIWEHEIDTGLLGVLKRIENAVCQRSDRQI